MRVYFIRDGIWEVRSDICCFSGSYRSQKRLFLAGDSVEIVHIYHQKKVKARGGAYYPCRLVLDNDRKYTLHPDYIADVPSWAFISPENMSKLNMPPERALAFAVAQLRHLYHIMSHGDGKGLDFGLAAQAIVILEVTPGDCWQAPLGILRELAATPEKKRLEALSEAISLIETTMREETR